MSIQIVPTPPPGVAFSEQRTTLEGVDYTLKFRWNARDSAWYMDIADAEAVTLRTGIKLVPNFRLLFYVPPLADLPPGDFMLFGKEGAGAAPDLDTLSTEWVLYYVES